MGRKLVADKQLWRPAEGWQRSMVAEALSRLEASRRRSVWASQAEAVAMLPRADTELFSDVWPGDVVFAASDGEDGEQVRMCIGRAEVYDPDCRPGDGPNDTFKRVGTDGEDSCVYHHAQTLVLVLRRAERPAGGRKEAR